MTSDPSVEVKPSILYVDDEFYNLVIFKAMFDQRYTIFTATSAKEGREILRNNKIDVIIADQLMPEVTGVEFLKSIVNDYPNAVRIIMTGHADINAIIQAINECKIFHYLTKPWNEDELKQVIENAIHVGHLEKHVNELFLKLNEELLVKENVINIFEKYVPPAIVTRMLDPLKDKELFDGEDIVISVLFSDIRNFVKIASQLGSKKTVTYLNKYFTMMSECVKNQNGTVDKFIGDGMLVLFGAPIPYQMHQQKAVLCALDMLDSLEKFNKEYAEQLGFNTTIGIGINTGPAIVGNIGSDQYIEYTAIGDAVNMAARVEGLTRNMHNAVLITQSTYDSVKDIVAVEKLESQEIRGKTQKITVYKVTGKISSTTDSNGSKSA